VYVDGGLGDVGGEPGHGGDTSQPAAVVVDRQDETAVRAGAALGPRRQQPQTRTTRHTHLQKHDTLLRRQCTDFCGLKTQCTDMVRQQQWRN